MASINWCTDTRHANGVENSLRAICPACRQFATRFDRYRRAVHALCVSYISLFTAAEASRNHAQCFVDFALRPRHKGTVQRIRINIDDFARPCPPFLRTVPVGNVRAELQTLAASRGQFYQQANENGMVKQVQRYLQCDYVR